MKALLTLFIAAVMLLMAVPLTHGASVTTQPSVCGSPYVQISISQTGLPNSPMWNVTVVNVMYGGNYYNGSDVGTYSGGISPIVIGCYKPYEYINYTLATSDSGYSIIDPNNLFSGPFYVLHSAPENCVIG